jgi:hypothetical protein
MSLFNRALGGKDAVHPVASTALMLAPHKPFDVYNTLISGGSWFLLLPKGFQIFQRVCKLAGYAGFGAICRASAILWVFTLFRHRPARAAVAGATDNINIEWYSDLV